VFVINNSYQPHMLLKPESPSSQNNNIGEQSSSSSAISITGADRDLVRYSLLTATLCHVSHILFHFLHVYFSTKISFAFYFPYCVSVSLIPFLSELDSIW
jgi:hypothetical protein